LDEFLIHQPAKKISLKNFSAEMKFREIAIRSSLGFRLHPGIQILTLWSSPDVAITARFG
jgi:hypothetical protein